MSLASTLAELHDMYSEPADAYPECCNAGSGWESDSETTKRRQSLAHMLQFLSSRQLAPMAEPCCMKDITPKPLQAQVCTDSFMW